MKFKLTFNFSMASATVLMIFTLYTALGLYSHQTTLDIILLWIIFAIALINFIYVLSQDKKEK